MLYFDHNATHPLTPAAKAAWLDAVERFPSNPSSPHRLGQRAGRALDEARERLAAILGCTADEIVFTSGATESANMVLHNAGPSVASAIEHPCVRENRSPGFPEISVNESGELSLPHLQSILECGSVGVVAVMAANNETGVLQRWRETLQICRDRNVRFFCDAAQWLGRMPARGLGECDFVSGCAHKFGGPVGVGFLKCPGDFPALLRGGPQEEGRRAGTENIAGVLAMVAALEEAESRIARELDTLLVRRDEFIRSLLSAIPGAKVIGLDAPRLWNTVSVLMPELPDCRRRWVVAVDKAGAAVSTGSACSSGKEKPSHVLRAMGIPPGDAGRALRFSAGWQTTPEDWLRLVEILKDAVTGMSSNP